MTSKRFRDLGNSLYLAAGAKVNLASNIGQGVGLKIGWTGVVQDIVYENGQTITDMPIFIVVEWYEYIGPPFL